MILFDVASEREHCIADFFRNVAGNERHLIGLQVVTMGRRALEAAREWALGRAGRIGCRYGRAVKAVLQSSHRVSCSLTGSGCQYLVQPRFLPSPKSCRNRDRGVEIQSG